MKHWLFRTTPQRAVAEAVLLMSATLLALFVATSGTWDTLGGSQVLIGPMCALWAAVRMRIRAGMWRQQAVRESKLAFVLGVLLSVILLVFVLGGEYRRDPGSITLSRFSWDEVALLAIGPFVLHAGAYAGTRVAVQVWIWWNRTRRTRFIWSLTHTILMAALLAVSPFVLLLAYGFVSSAITSANSVLSVVASAVPAVLVLAALTVAGLLCVLPAALIIAFFSARRLTRRLEALTTATSHLRTGDYGARSAVQGEDEVAQLQRNFNTMAADLEHAIAAVQAERDSVQTLLDNRRQLIANVSHELRTPVATLRGYLDAAMAQGNGALPPALHHDLNVMQRETVRLQTLIDDLFTLSRAEVSKLDVRSQPTDINALVQRCVDVVASQAWHQSKVDVLADGAPQHAEAFVDGARTEQIVFNLLHNAIRHTSPGGIVAASVRVDTNVVIVEVRDTGEGIPPDDLPHIWERFRRAHNERAGAQGAGLGLALVKELAETMGGTVAVESVLGEGSCFTVRLPRAQVSTR